MVKTIINDFVKKITFTSRYLGLVMCIHIFVPAKAQTDSVGRFGSQYIQKLQQSRSANVISKEATLSYGQSLSDVPASIFLEEHTQWQVYQSDSLLGKGNGLSLLSFVFQQPGTYSIKAYTPEKRVEGGCNHGDVDLTISLKVTEYAVQYLFDSQFWLTLFASRKSFVQALIALPVRVSYYQNSSPVIFRNLRISLSGVDCTLIAQQVGEATLPQGDHILTFLFDGRVGNQIYAMVDFSDSDGRVQSHAIQGIIK